MSISNNKLITNIITVYGNFIALTGSLGNVILCKEPSLYCDASRLLCYSLFYCRRRPASARARYCLLQSCYRISSKPVVRYRGEPAKRVFFHRHYYFCINIAKIILSHRRPTHDDRLHL
jgi:hypothetical protein